LRIGGEIVVKTLGDGSLKPRGRQREQSPGGRTPDDSVEISDAAKQLHQDSAAAGRSRAGSRADQDPAGLRARIQERIASGFYDSEEVIKEVARKILDIIGY